MRLQLVAAGTAVLVVGLGAACLAQAEEVTVDSGVISGLGARNIGKCRPAPERQGAAQARGCETLVPRRSGGHPFRRERRETIRVHVGRMRTASAFDAPSRA